MSTMTAERRHAPPIREITTLELAQAGPGHGLAALVPTVDGEILAVCACALVGVGATEDEARLDLTAQHGN